ncbi:poly-gamma-glutamate synthase PgsB [Candidatus Bipolaricaulota bacterium]|nr:poly-gamma-glutamate synthase PgsB [Candidatus Bipolaricaulota bacterium]
MLLIIVSACLFVFLLYLGLEKYYLSSILKDIPVRICITGTRGKSSVVRLVHAGLRGSGLEVLGKTTGSQPSLLLPDGSEKEIERRGVPSILEQRSTLRHADDYGVDAYVVELMSIHTEYHRVESTRLLKPNLVGITKLALDHLPQMGESIEDVANSLAAGLPESAMVVVGDEAFTKHANWTQGRPELISAKDGSNREMVNKISDSLTYLEFEDNIQLALSIAGEVDELSESVVNGMCETRPDPGSLRAWSISGSADLQCKLIVVNAFAANEPESTKKALDKFQSLLSNSPDFFFGLLNLRSDRGRRTLQWRSALASGDFSEFDRIYVTGEQAEKFQSMLGGGLSVRALESTDPKSIMDNIFEQIEGRGVLFGFGNIGGMGGYLVDHWMEVGDQL